MSFVNDKFWIDAEKKFRTNFNQGTREKIIEKFTKLLREQKVSNDGELETILEQAITEVTGKYPILEKSITGSTPGYRVAAKEFARKLYRVLFK